jgi:hypothetical protein
VRIVIYDDEDMEPITVVDLRGVTMRDVLNRGARWRIAVPMPVRPRPMSNEEARIAANEQVPICELWFERFVRVTADGRRQQSFMAFTKAADLAMLLNPDFLPGQRSAVDYLQEQNDQLTSLLMRVW